jgi:site-specific recombinase XerD
MNSAQALEALRLSLRRQQCSLATERTYCGWLARYMRFLRLAPESAATREKKVEAFLTDLAVNRRSASSQNQALNALVFFHTHALEQPLAGVDALRARRPQRVRVALPRTLTNALADQMARAEALWREDFRERVPVPLPGLLRNKRPHAEYSRDWRWLFPAENVCTDARQGRTVRWRCHEAIVQREFARASARLRLCPALTPHHLRHAYATHCLEDGVNIRALQAAMGHKSLETTMTYLHADPLSVASPLDVWTASHAQSAFLRTEPQR